MNQLDGSISFSPASPLLEYDVTAFLDTLPAYNQSAMRDGDLELARQIIRSNDYYYYGYPFPQVPDGEITNIAALSTITGSVSVPPYSYLTGMSYFFADSYGASPSKEFQVRIYDKGAKTDLFYNRFAQAGVVLGNTYQAAGASGFELLFPKYADNPAVSYISPLGTNLLTSPMIMLPPGLLQVEITNQDTVARLFQILFNFAVPLNKTSTNVNKVGS